MTIWLPVRVAAVLAATAVSAPTVSAGLAAPRSSVAATPVTYQVLRQDVIINADIWAAKPEMMAAGLGFTNIVGVPNLSTSDVPLSKTLAVNHGGTWNNVRCANGQTPPLASYTSASTPSGVRKFYGEDVYYSDGLPVEFSWPLLPSTLDADDFRVTLNNGTSVTPQVTSIWPNYLYNERSVAVLFGHFGNRIPPNQPGAIYPVSVQIIRGSSTLELVGPGQRIVSAVGMSVRSPGSPYTAPGVPPAGRGGPTLVAAKLEQDVGGGQHRAQDLPAEPAQRRDQPLRQAGEVPAAHVHVGRHDAQRRHPASPDRVQQVLPGRRRHVDGEEGRARQGREDLLHRRAAAPGRRPGRSRRKAGHLRRLLHRTQEQLHRHHPGRQHRRGAADHHRADPVSGPLQTAVQPGRARATIPHPACTTAPRAHRSPSPSSTP